MSICSKCKTKNRKGLAQCKRCGNALLVEPPLIACPRCGVPHHPNVRYCSKCGANTAPNATAWVSANAAPISKAPPAPLLTVEKSQTEKGMRVLKVAAVLVLVASVSVFLLNKKPAEVATSEVAPELSMVEKESIVLDPQPAAAPVSADILIVEAVAAPEVSTAKRKPSPPAKTVAAPTRIAKESSTPIASEPPPLKKPVAEQRQCADLPLFYELQCKLHGASLWFKCAPDGRSWNDELPGCKIRDDQ